MTVKKNVVPETKVSTGSVQDLINQMRGTTASSENHNITEASETSNSAAPTELSGLLFESFAHPLISSMIDCTFLLSVSILTMAFGTVFAFVVEVCLSSPASEIL